MFSGDGVWCRRTGYAHGSRERTSRRRSHRSVGTCTAGVVTRSVPVSRGVPCRLLRFSMERVRSTPFYFLLKRSVRRWATVFVPFESDANGLGPAILIGAAIGNVFQVAAFSCAVKSLAPGLQSPPTSVENRASTRRKSHQLSTAKIKNIATGCGQFNGEYGT